MNAGIGARIEQADNAQAAVETDSRLFVATQVTAAPNDQEQLAPTMQAVPAPVRGQVGWFSLRGWVGAELAWTLVCLADNLRRLHRLFEVTV
jgi:hypothetical protein